MQPVAGDHFTSASSRSSTSARDVDVVLMRQDPPFDLGYITATHLLERIQAETLVVNDPAAVRNAPEKMWVLDFARFMPPTALTRSLGFARKFLDRAWRDRPQAAPWQRRQSGVQDRPRRCQSRAADGAVQRDLSRTAHAPGFLPEVAEGDKRIVLVDGEFAGAINRRPATGEIRSNLAAGGTAEAAELTATRAGNLRSARSRAQASRTAVRRHRRHRRTLADRDQRHLADRHRRHRQVQRHRHARPHLGRDRSPSHRPQASLKR